MKAKLNKDSVRDYHKKLVNIQIRIPAPSEKVPDYKQMIQNHAKAKGLSVNSYILSLIESDMGISIAKGIRDTK